MERAQYQMTILLLLLLLSYHSLGIVLDSKYDSITTTKLYKVINIMQLSTVTSTIKITYRLIDIGEDLVGRKITCSQGFSHDPSCQYFGQVVS